MRSSWAAVGTVAACLAAVAICSCGKGSYRPPRSPEPHADVCAPAGQQAGVSAAAANPVTVSPLPGTLDASPQTQISFLGARGTRVSDVRVVGSVSGVHV